MSERKRLQERLRKAIRRELRTYGIERSTELQLQESPTQAFVVAQKLLQILLPRTKISVVKKGGLIPISREELNARLLATFLSGKPQGSLFTDHFLFCTASQADLQMFAKIEGLERRELVLDEQERAAYEFSSQVQKKQPQTAAALAKSYWNLRKTLGKENEGHKK